MISSSPNVRLTQPMDPEKKSLNFIFPTKYVIPKSLKFSHWPSKESECDKNEPPAPRKLHSEIRFFLFRIALTQMSDKKHPALLSIKLVVE